MSDRNDQRRPGGAEWQWQEVVVRWGDVGTRIATLWRQPLAPPAPIRLQRVAQPVMQATLAALPELPVVGRGPIRPGAAVQIWTCNGWENQRFTWERNGQISSGGLCLDIENADRDDGGKLIVWPCSGSANQRWRARGRDIVSDLKGADADGDGKLAFKEVVVARMAYFDAADANNDDQLSMQECVDHQRRLGGAGGKAKK